MPTDEELIIPFDGTFFSPLTASRKIEYMDAWNTYVLIATIQRQIQSDRITDKTAAYYRFPSYAVRQLFIRGMQLHQQAYPLIDWCSEFYLE